MGQTKLTNEEKTQALILLVQEMSVICVAMNLKVTKMVIYNLIKAAAVALPSTLPQHKEGSGLFFFRDNNIQVGICYHLTIQELVSP